MMDDLSGVKVLRQKWEGQKYFEEGDTGSVFKRSYLSLFSGNA
jgi:hypothetical protein